MRQLIDADEPPSKLVAGLGQRRRQRALAPVQEQPVAGPQHAEELAEDPRSLGVDLQRALAVGKAAHAHVAVPRGPLTAPAVAEDGAGATEVERLTRRERVAQIVANVEDEEERQQRSSDGDHRVATARVRDVREFVEDASRVASGSFGWGRIAHVSRRVGAEPSTGFGLP